jgi:hypothetical protein
MAPTNDIDRGFSVWVELRSSGKTCFTPFQIKI